MQPKPSGRLWEVAVHEAGHAAIARLHGSEAVVLLRSEDEATTYYSPALAGLSARLMAAAGPVAEYRLAHPQARARDLWHAYRAGSLARCFSPSDALLAGPVTRNLLGAALVAVAAHWPAILAEAAAEVRILRALQFGRSHRGA